MIVYTLKMCIFYFVHISGFIFIFRGLELRHFFIPPTLEKLKGHIALGSPIRQCVCSKLFKENRPVTMNIF